MTDPVLLSRQGEIAVVTLNEPERRNALSIALRERLFEVLDAAMASDARAIVLAGASGSKDLMSPPEQKLPPAPVMSTLLTPSA